MKNKKTFLKGDGNFKFSKLGLKRLRKLGLGFRFRFMQERLRAKRECGLE